MRKWWTGTAVTVMMTLTASLHAQPAPEPLPFAPSTAGAGGPMGPMGPTGPEGGSPTSLPADLPNIATPPGPVYDDNYRVYVNFEYLHWWIKSDDLNQTFITTTSAIPDPAGQFAQFGQTGTMAIAGGGPLHSGPLDGGRMTIGVFPPNFVPMEISGFWSRAGNKTLIQSGVSGNPVIARPIFSLDPTVFTETVYLSSFPDLVTGSAGITSNTEFYGAEATAYLMRVSGSPEQTGFIVELTGGARYLALNESLDISNTATSLSDLAQLNFNGGGFGQGFTTAVADHFRTRNQYGGTQIGLRATYPTRLFNLNIKADTGAGMNHQFASVQGFSFLYNPPIQVVSPLSPAPTQAQPTVVFGGIQAVPSNSGTFSRNKISTVSDLSVAIEVPVRENISISFGYDFIYWTGVARPGKQLNRAIDTQQVPTDVNFIPGVSTLPQFLFNQSNFFADGLTLSLALLF